MTAMIQPFKATISILGLLGLICIYQINSKVTRWSLNSLLTTQPAFLHESSTSSTNSPRQHATHDLEYVPSKIESYFLEHAIELGYDVERPTPSGCAAWLNKSLPLAADLTAFRSEMEEYHNRLVAFNGTVKDLRKYIETNPEICDTLELHPEGLKGIFPSGSLTQTRHGLLEPIYPPMRDSGICFQPFRQKLFSLDYLVHDFAAYCRQLKPTSRNVLVDLGASLDFHKSGIMPAVFLTQIYERFGFHWDHIYAYEIREKVPQDVFQKVPDELFHAYHWINVGVSADPDSKLNPWNMILQEYEEDDFVVVKLDIDTSWIEIPLAYQLLESPQLLKLVDVLYFEHHVFLQELGGNWGRGKNGTLLSSLELFTMLRKGGIDAHSWV